jgi:hypothetical protein
MATPEFKELPLFAQVTETTQACSACFEQKPVSAFQAPTQGKEERAVSKCQECRRTYFKQHYQKQRQAVSEKRKQWRKEHPEEQREKKKKEYAKFKADPIRVAACKVKRRLTERRRRAMNPTYKIREAERKRRIKILVINQYSNGTNQCACCGEHSLEFLVIDHINGGGGRHRREVKNLYPWLIGNGFPEGFRVLCHNCNFALGIFGFCPHKTKTEE